jgi:UDP-galactopyranose mutase
VGYDLTTKKVDYLILGAGITGLSVAYHLKDADYALYEKDDAVGGMCRSEQQDGFCFDYGEHFIRANDPYIYKLLNTLLKDNFFGQPLNASIHIDSSRVDYPFQTNLYGLPPSMVKSCLMGYIKAWCQQKPSTYNNFRDWIYATFGDGIAEYFMIPYNRKIWTVDPSEMTTDWFFNESVVPAGSLDQVIEGALLKQPAKKPQRWYPLRGGIISLAKAFLRQIKNVHCSKSVVSVDPDSKVVIFHDGEVIKYRYLINTIPLPELIMAINNPPKTVAQAAKNLLYNSVFCVNLGVNRENLSDQHWIYFPEEKYVFARAYFLSNFAASMAPQSCSSVSAMVTYSKFKPIDKTSLYLKVIWGLKEAGILKNNDEILTSSIFDVKYGFNLFTHDRASNMAIIKAYLRQKNIYSLGRYGNWEYSGIEHAILNSKSLVEAVIAK